MLRLGQLEVGDADARFVQCRHQLSRLLNGNMNRTPAGRGVSG